MVNYPLLLIKLGGVLFWISIIWALLNNIFDSHGEVIELVGVLVSILLIVAGLIIGRGSPNIELG